jgi:hypothetical protein
VGEVEENITPEQEALMLKLAVLIGMLVVLVYQYPDFAQAAQKSVQLEMSHFFPPAQH